MINGTIKANWPTISPSDVTQNSISEEFLGRKDVNYDDISKVLKILE